MVTEGMDEVDLGCEEGESSSNHSGGQEDGQGEKIPGVENGGTTVSFHNITCQVKIKKTDKLILQDVSGIFPLGMNAILGPTGSGKTTLLNIIAKRCSAHEVSGTVLINGVHATDIKNMSGYIAQDNTVMGTLTVRENLAFSAAIRLPHGAKNRKDKTQRVEDVITELGLIECADTKVECISGGERKRTNIGMELIIEPKILFLDEPSSGVDASCAYNVIMLLKRLANRGRTIIFSIHQPRYAIYRQFDTLLLLSKGETVFHGTTDGALKYFETIGYHCVEHNNPPDFFLDIIDETSHLQHYAYTNHAIHLVDEVETDNHNTHITLGDMPPSSRTNGIKQSNGTVSINNNSSHSCHKKSLVEHYRKSSYYRQLKERSGMIVSASEKEMKEKKNRECERKYATSFLIQLFYVSRRALLNFGRNPVTIFFMPLNALILALIIGGIYWQQDMSLSSGIQNRTGAFLFIILNMIFGNLGAVDIFLAERTIYRPSAYFLAKVFCDLIPFRLLPALMFSAVSYWMIGFKSDGDSFFIYALTVTLTSICACFYAFLISITVSTYSVVILLVSSTFIVMLVFSGVLVNIASLPAWLQWIQYLSIMRYSLNVLSINELTGLVFCGVRNNMTLCETGEAYMEEQGIDSTLWGLWQNVLALFCFTVGFLLITYIQLRRSHSKT